MKTSLLILLLAAVTAIGAELIPLSQHDPLQVNGTGPAAPASLPVSLNIDQSLSLPVPATGNRQRNLVSVRIDGPSATLRLGDETVSLDAGNADCQSHPPNRLECRVRWSRTDRFQREATAVVVQPDTAAVRVLTLDVKSITQKRVSRLADEPVFVIAIVVLLGIPLIWGLHRSYVWSQWAIVGIGLFSLTLLQPAFTAALMLFLLAMYGAGTVLQSRENRPVGVLLSLLLASIGFLLVFKSGLPLLAEVFANPGGLSLALPLGLSYFVIRLIDTQLNWYRGMLKDLTVREYLCFMIFPPTVASGPIETATSFRQHRLPTITGDDIGYGLMRIALGVMKKLFVADLFLAQLVDANVYQVAADPIGVEGEKVAVLLLSNFLFAYIDFSAYSDIAIGLGRLYGYRINENFNFPILRENLRKYWQNWHMSLSHWAMRNIYMVGAMATRNSYVPLYLTMIAIGLWHSMGVPWLMWGIHHASGLALLAFLANRQVSIDSPRLRWVLRPAGIAATIVFVSIGHGFVLFDAVDVSLMTYARAWSLLVGNF